jgi:N-methylhydantoinase A
LERKADEEFKHEGHSLDLLKIVRQVDVRYKGQSHELTVDLPEAIDGKSIADLFDEAHQSRYSFHRPESAVEIVNIRLVAILQIDPPSLQPVSVNDQDSAEYRIGQKPIYFEGGYQVSDMYDRTKLRPGVSLDGPAVVFQYDTTTLIPPGWQAEVDSFGNLLLTNQVSG